MSREDTISIWISQPIVSAWPQQDYYLLEFCTFYEFIFKLLDMYIFLRFEKKNFLLPWIGLTMVGPCLFLSYLVLDILFLNFTAASRLMLTEGVVTTVTLYLVTTVYSLYLDMAAPPALVIDDAFDEEHTGYR